MEQTINILPKGDSLVITTVKGLDAKAPEKISIEGQINSVLEFIRVRKPDPNQCHIICDESDLSITLVDNDTDPYKKGSIKGQLKYHEDFEMLGINAGKSWTTFGLSDYFKMNRHLFQSREICADIVKKLREFKAKIDKEIEMSKDDRANFNIKKRQAVDTNIPEKFDLKIQIIKGESSVMIPAEIVIDPETLACSLISPEAKDYIRELKDNLIFDQVKKIREIDDYCIIFK